VWLLNDEDYNQLDDEEQEKFWGNFWGCHQ